MGADFRKGQNDPRDPRVREGIRRRQEAAARDLSSRERARQASSQQRREFERDQAMRRAAQSQAPRQSPPPGFEEATFRRNEVEKARGGLGRRASALDQRRAQEQSYERERQLRNMVESNEAPVGSTSPRDDSYFDLDKYNAVAKTVGRPTASSVEDLQKQAASQAASKGPDDYFDLDKYNAVARTVGKPTFSSVEDLKRKAAGARSIEELERRQRQQELDRRMSARSRSNRRNSRSRSTGDRRSGMVFGPGRSMRMPDARSPEYQQILNRLRSMRGGN